MSEAINLRGNKSFFDPRALASFHLTVPPFLCMQAYFYDKAIFTKVAEVSTALYDLADDIESAVSPFLNIILDILEAIERGMHNLDIACGALKGEI